MVITGLGWFRDGRYGHRSAPSCGDAQEGASLYSQLRSDGILPGPMQDFGRLNTGAKQTCAAVGAALRDAHVSEDGGGRNGVIGIVGNGSALDANREFFTDYISNGRSLARGSLFVHTLPSSPLAAAAMCYKLSGPLLNFRQVRDTFGGPVERAIEMLDQKLAGAMVVAYEDTTGILGCVLQTSARRGQSVCLQARDMQGGVWHLQSVAEIIEGILMEGAGH